jgi:hypothetical protein
MRPQLAPWLVLALTQLFEPALLRLVLQQRLRARELLLSFRQRIAHLLVSHCCQVLRAQKLLQYSKQLSVFVLLYQ